MATYLSLTNEILREMNEVALTSSTFANAIGVQQHVKDVINRAKRLAKEKGLLVGISAGANVLAAERWVKENNPEHPVVTILCDRGERYFSCYED